MAIVGEGVFYTVKERSVVCTQMRVSGIPAIGILYSKNCRGQGPNTKVDLTNKNVSLKSKTDRQSDRQTEPIRLFLC